MIAMRSFPALTLGVILSGAATPAIAAQCASGWAGSVHYSRTQETNDSKTVPKLSGKGNATTTASMTYNYAAQVAVRPTADPDNSVAKANINMSQTASETVRTTDEDICRHTYERRQVSGTSVSKSVVSASASGLEAEVNVSLDSDDSYTISVRLPQLNGTTSGSQSSTFSGQCVAKPGTSHTLPESPYSIDPVSFGSEGNDRIRASDPNRLTGSFVKTWQGVTERLSWNLRRCGPALRLVDLKFEDMKFPTWEAWQEISEQRGTIDGNRVRVTAIVANDGAAESAATVKFKETYKGDKWDGARPDNGIRELSVVVPAGEQREVRFDWDSSGYAWFDDGRPRLVQRIRAELEDKGKKVDEQVKNLKIAPRPLVLAHGLWSTWRAWEPWQNILTTSHSYDWKAFPVGEKPEHGLMNTGQEFGNLEGIASIGENARHLESYVDYARRDRNAWHVDIVAHSLGGLISRYYISQIMGMAPDAKPIVTRLVMLGTPNMGSRCATFMSFAAEMTGKYVYGLDQLTPDHVAGFNRINTQRKGVQFSVLAGNPLPTMCATVEWNDGVVPVSSAAWTISDVGQMSVLHTDLTGTGPFSSFVKPRLAIGPKGQVTTEGTAARVLLIDDTGPTATDPARPDFARRVTLAPRQTLDVELPVKAGRSLGLTFLAAPDVSATLTDDRGAPAGASLTKTPGAVQLFRSIHVDRAVTASRWTIRLENSGDVEREVLIASASHPH